MGDNIGEGEAGASAQVRNMGVRLSDVKWPLLLIAVLIVGLAALWLKVESCSQRIPAPVRWSGVETHYEAQTGPGAEGQPGGK